MAVSKTILVLLAFLLVASVSLSAQKSPLTVTGSVTEVKIFPHLVPVLINQSDPWGGYRYERYERMEPWFGLTVRLQFCNKDNSTIIIPTIGSLNRGTTKVLFLELPAQDSPVSAAANRYSSGNVRQFVDPIPTFMKEFERPDPSGFSFAVVESGTCYNATDVILVKSGYKIQTQMTADKTNRPVENAVPEHPQFKIQYSISIKDSLPVSEAKRRWSQLGKLLTTADGDFFFETDVIINKLPN